MTIEEKINKVVNSILDPYTLATEAENKRVGDIVRKALLKQDRDSRADERKRLASGRMLTVALKKAVEVGMFPKYADDEQYAKDWAGMRAVINAIMEG